MDISINIDPGMAVVVALALIGIIAILGFCGLVRRRNKVVDNAMHELDDMALQLARMGGELDMLRTFLAVSHAKGEQS